VHEYLGADPEEPHVSGKSKKEKGGIKREKTIR